MKVGSKHSKETRRKIGLGNKGKTISKEQREKISKSMLKSLKSKGKFVEPTSGYTFIRHNKKYVKEHHYIWCNESEWGFIPEGFVVHHINRDKTDNRIENLACIPRDYHTKMHWAMGDIR